MKSCFDDTGSDLSVISISITWNGGVVPSDSSFLLFNGVDGWGETQFSRCFNRFDLLMEAQK